MLRQLLMVIAVLGVAAPAFAQNQAVQQPVVRQQRLGTSVSVPDRGRAFLGGVSSGATSTNRYGPFRSGTNSGREFSNSSQTVSVYIHDFEEMDQALLNSGRPQNRAAARRDEKPLNPRAAHAWRTLASRHGQR